MTALLAIGTSFAKRLHQVIEAVYVRLAASIELNVLDATLFCSQFFSGL